MDDTITSEMLVFYSSHSSITNPGRHRVHIDGLTAVLPEMCKLVQGMILHVHLIEKYGINLPEKRKQEALCAIKLNKDKL